MSVQNEASRLADTPDGADRWTAFVSAHDRATAYHTLAWKRTIESAFGYESRYLLVTADDTEDVIAVVPGFDVPEILGTSVKNPFCEYGFPLIAPGVETSRVLETIRECTSRRRAIILKDCPFSGVSGYSETGYAGVETGVTHRLDVDTDFERLREDVFDDTLRRTARRSGEHDVTIEEGDDLEAYYSLYVATMRRLGSPQFPISFFEALRDEFGTDFHYHVAEKSDKLVAGLVALSQNGTLYLLSNAWDRTGDPYSFNSHLYLSVIEQACDTGFETVDFGRTEPDTGVDQFKSHFGGTVLPLVSFVAPPRHAGRASVSGYKRLAPITRLLSPIVTQQSIGPKLKRRIHE